MKKVIALLLALTLVFSLAACSAKQETPPPEEAPSDKTPTEEAAPATEPAEEPAEEPAQESGSAKILDVASTDTIDDFNPFTNQQTVFLCLMNTNCLETLIYMNDAMEYTPSLATEWEISPDGLTYTFKLREGVKYHDGTDFTSEDVKFTLETTVDEATGAWRQPNFATITNIDCPDDYTVVLTLSNPTPALLDSFTTLPITSSEQDPATYSTTPIGTGAFKFVSYSTNDNITFEKFDDYWDAGNVKLDGYVIHFSADLSTAINSLKAGDLDLVTLLDASYAKNIEETEGLSVVKSPTSNTTYLMEIGLHNREEFRNPDVLKAMFMCLDTQTIADQVFYGYATPSKGVVHAGAKYYTEAYADITYDVDAAAALLATTPYASGFEFELPNLGGAYETIAVIWQQDLAKIGITLKISTDEMSVWLEKYLGRTYDMIANGYSMVGTDPATFMSLIIGGLYDYQCSEDIIPGLREKIDAAAATAVDAEREEMYAEIFDILAEYMPVYTYLCVDNLCAASDNLSGVIFNGEARYIFTYADIA